MKQFKDKQQDTWRVELNIGSVKRVRDVLSVDLMKLDEGEPPLVVRLQDDEILVGEIIAELLGDQLEARGLTADQMLSRFDGETAEAAYQAFMSELEGFFHQRGRGDKAEMVSRTRKMMEKAISEATARIREADGESTPGNSSTVLPVVSQSILPA